MLDLHRTRGRSPAPGDRERRSRCNVAIWARVERPGGAGSRAFGKNASAGRRCRTLCSCRGRPRGRDVIKVLIAEDMHMIRGALVALLRLEPDINVVAELDRGDRIVETAEKTRPDVAVIDIDLPGLDGLSAAEALHERLPSCRTLILTGLTQPGNLLCALKGHVKGFLLKDAPATALANAIRSVAEGRRVLELVAVAVETGASPPTDRETDVCVPPSREYRRMQSALSSISLGRPCAIICRMPSANWAHGIGWRRYGSRRTPAGFEPPPPRLIRVRARSVHGSATGQTRSDRASLRRSPVSRRSE